MNRIVFWIGVVLAVLGIVNFIVFAVIAQCIGGDAQMYDGPIDGRYYVGQHGKKTEVKEAVWRYSRIHSPLTLALHVFAMFGMILAAACTKLANFRPN
jgi:hypothetical protein